MELHELALEYRESAGLCAERVAQLRRQLPILQDASTELMLLRRRISILESMERDAYATSKYLENYYRRPINEGNSEKTEINGEGDRVPEPEELRKAIRAAIREHRSGNRRSA